jgi:RNA-dependent RNA polymerase
VGRNPSLHPGDLRVLTPRNVRALHHLVDVVVFPSNGERPHCDEMSGGDLDGDIYFVIWDTDLIPKTDFTPMAYAGEYSAVNRDIVDAIIYFFILLLLYIYLPFTK